MSDVSIIIPARNEIYLQATIDDLLKNMESDIEIIVGLDEYWPNPPLKDDPRVIVYHSAERIGMRPMINKLAAIAKGRYLMKTDAHCSFDHGYDKKLMAIMQPGYTVLGIRYELDPVKWERKDRTNCDFRYLSHPDADPLGGLRGLAWHEYKDRTKGQEVAETMTISGSGWMMEKVQFDRWGGLDENHGTFGQEGAEISCKTWLSGGRVLVNRRTWYAHHNRGKAPYALSTKQRDKSVNYSIEFWMNDRWPLQKYSFQWLIDRFAPVPGWTGENVKTLPAPRQGTILKGIKKLTVDELWEHRVGIAEPLKRERLKIFYDSFSEVIRNLAAGKEYTQADMEASRYFEYLRTHLGNRHRDPLTEEGRAHVLRKFDGAINLFHSIKTKGLKAPLACYAKDGILILWKGYRRLVILKVLGVKDAPIQMHKSEAVAKGMPAHFAKPAPGSIQAIGEQQFLKYGAKATDKYWVHGYLEIYDKLFASLRRERIKLLELGVLRGASLALWHRAFPKAQIYGVDKNLTTWKEFTEGLDRVKVLVGNQEDNAVMKKVTVANRENRAFMQKVAAAGPFDIIIDDGSHHPDLQFQTFNALWGAVKPCGYYIIEDCFHSFKPGWEGINVPKEMAKWIDRIYSGYSVLSLHYFYNLVVVRKGI